MVRFLSRQSLQSPHPNPPQFDSAHYRAGVPEEGVRTGGCPDVHHRACDGALNLGAITRLPKSCVNLMAP